MDCCSVYESEFDRESAISAAQRYRTQGLTGPARVMADVLRGLGIADKTIIDFGGGVGSLGLDLVRAGAASSVNVELSSSYRTAAAALALEFGLADRVTIRIADAAAPVADLGTADIVVMNKVICCYPDGEALMEAAAGAATRFLAVSYPAVHAISKAVIGLENWLRHRRGSGFRAYVHGHDVLDRPATAGWETIHLRRRPVWSVTVWGAAAA